MERGAMGFLEWELSDLNNGGRKERNLRFSCFSVVKFPNFETCHSWPSPVRSIFTGGSP